MKSIDDWLEKPGTPAGVGLFIQFISLCALFIIAGGIYSVA